MILSLLSAILVQDVSAPVSLPRTEVVVWESEILEGERYIQIGLPILPSPGGTELPIVLMTDGDVMFGLATETARLMSFEGTPPPLVIAGVSYGSLQTWIGQRGTDYHPGEGYTGLAAFTSALVSEGVELVRSVEASATGPVIVYGHSSGGLVALEAALIPGVDGVIVSSPSLEEEPEWSAELAQRFAAAESLPDIYLSIGEEETATLEAIEAFLAESGLETELHVFESSTHMQVIPSAFANGLRTLFAPE